MDSLWKERERDREFRGKIKTRIVESNILQQCIDSTIHFEEKLFLYDARNKREREREREINLGTIEIKISLNCCSFGRNMVETFVGDEKKKNLSLLP